MKPVDYAAIETFEHLIAVYDYFINRLRQHVDPAHLGGLTFDDLATKGGERFIVNEARDGDDFMLVRPVKARPGRFSVVFNERGKPGVVSSTYEPREVLAIGLNNPLRQLAWSSALREFERESGFERTRNQSPLPKELWEKVREMRDQEVQRLRSVLGPDWPTRF